MAGVARKQRDGTVFASPLAALADDVMRRNLQGGWTGRHAICMGLVYALLDLADAIRGLR